MDEDYFWHTPRQGWRYTRGGVEVGPFDLFEDAAEDYYAEDYAATEPG